MDLSIVKEECDQAFMGKWIDVGASKLCLNYALYCCEELKMSKAVNDPIRISTDDLAYLISSKILIGWSGLKDKNGNDVPFSQLNAFNSLANDFNFLDLVSKLFFERSNFV